MKRVLSLVLALVLVLGMIPTFAAGETGAELLQQYEFITGFEDGDLKVDNMLTREQLAVLILQVNGEATAALDYKIPADYPDSAVIASWAMPYVAYAQTLGLMTGRTSGNFDPRGVVTGQELAAVLMNALGYKVDSLAKYATVVADAAALGIMLENVTLTRGEAFEAMWTAVADVPMNTEAGLTLGVFLGKIEASTPVVTELKIESVTATNLKEVVVVFNQPVDEDTVIADNFTLNKSLTSSATLLADGKTVVLAITPVATGQMANQAEYTLTAEKVKTAAGTELAEVVVPFTAFDATLPTVVSVTYTGPKNFEIKFSEPMKSYPTVTVKSGTSTLSVNAGGMTGIGTDVITVPLFSTLTDATTYAVNVTAATDFAGYVNVIKSVDAAYAKDVTAPTATVVKADQEYVVVEFSKPVSGLNPALFSHTFSAWKASKLTASDSYSAAAITSGTTFYVWFNGAADAAIDRPIAAGTTTLNILPKTTTPAAEILDLWGNKFVEVTLPITIVADKTAPEVKEVKIVTESSLSVEFTKNVSFTAANIEILDQDGKAITGVTPSVVQASGVKLYTVNFGKNLAGKTIIVNIKNVKDTTLSTNAMAAYTTTVAVTDKTAPTIDKVTYDAATKSLYVFFNENVDPATAVVAGNYYLVNGATFTKLTVAPAFINDSKTVKSVLTTAQAALVNPTVSTLFVTGVKDIAGNEIAANMSSAVAVHSTSVVPTMDTAEATARNKVVVTFAEELAIVDINAFKVDGVAPIAMDVALVDDVTVVTLTIADNYLAADTTGIDVVIFDNTLIKNLFNVSPTAFAALEIDDQIAPAIVTDGIVVAAGKITITFTEALNTVDVDPALYAQDLVLVKGTTTLVAGVDYRTTVAGTVLTIETVAGSALADGIYKVSSKAAITYVKDVNEVKAAPFTTVKELTNNFTNQSAVNAEAAGVAATLTAGDGTTAVGTVIKPVVAAGYTIAVKTTSAPAVYSATGALLTDGTSTVVYTVTQTATGLTADTAAVTVTVDVI